MRGQRHVMRFKYQLRPRSLKILKNPFTWDIFTTMIGFVTWPPFCTTIIYKGGDKANHGCDNTL